MAPYGYDDLPALMSRMTGDERHDAAAISTLDVLWVLYDRVMRLGGDDPDRFLLSKGHGPQAYYAVLAATGAFDPELLASFGEWESAFGHHPDHTRVPGVEISSGSLGHGLPIACGLAVGLRIQGRGSDVYCLVGDAEMDEGSNHEAIAVAGRFGLGNLRAVVVDNASATYGWPGGIERRFEVEGWTSVRCDGRDHELLEKAFRAADGERPHLVVAEVEGKWS